ncbi:MAG: redoxin domain-containing protein [Balneolaceae bacterium]|nr:redoxin domain-containing protein [Balneolaceae bacterium]
MSLLNKKAPNFELQNGEFEQISLNNLIGETNIVLLFYPLAFSSTCTEELCSVRDNMKIYEALDAKVFGISVDSLFVQKTFKKAQNLNFELLSDFNKDAMKAYGVFDEDFFGMHGVSKRSAFVIDKNGFVRYEEIHETSDQLPNFNAIQRILGEI